MNVKKSSLSSLLLTLLIFISTSISAVANTQIQVAESSNYFCLPKLLILGGLFIGLIGIIVVRIFPNYGYGIPTEPSLPPEERKKPV